MLEAIDTMPAAAWLCGVAALTALAFLLRGLLYHNHEQPKPVRWWTEQAYEYADAMLRERERVTESMPKEKRAEVSATLTAEERAAIHRAEARLRTAYVPDDETAATLRALLERLA